MNIETAFKKAKTMSDRAHVDVSMSVHPDPDIGDYAYYSINLYDGRAVNTGISWEECFETLERMDINAAKKKEIARLKEQLELLGGLL